MELREILYYLRQYRQYNIAGMVPDVTCDTCDTPFFPMADGDSVYLWCLVDDYKIDPGYGTIYEMIKRVQRIEG